MKLIAKIALKFFLLVLGTQLLFWALLLIFPETSSRNIGQEVGYRYIDEKVRTPSDDKFTYLVAGDSSAATAINTHFFYMDALILGVWGSSPAEVYFYVSNYLNTHPAPKCLLYTHLNAPDYYKDHAFWDFVVMYSDLPFNFFTELYDTSKKLGTFPGNTYSKPVFYAKYLLIKYKFFLFTQEMYIDKIKYAFRFKNAYKKTWKMINNFNGEYIRKKKGPGLRGDWWTFLDNPLPDDPMFNYYRNKLFSLVESKGIKLYTFLPPFSRELFEKYNVRMMAMEKKLSETTAQYKNAHYLKMREFYPEDFYIDQAHLNVNGSRAFTSKLAEQLDCE